MLNFLDKEKLAVIENATEEEISDMIMAVQARYHALFPDWYMHIAVFDKKADRNEQIDQIIATLQKLKTP